jgi:hypothetical protein
LLQEDFFAGFKKTVNYLSMTSGDWSQFPYETFFPRSKLEVIEKNLKFLSRIPKLAVKENFNAKITSPLIKI